jgi:8-oxo-dGTP diphosphatase
VLLLVRHARAGSSQEWEGDDRLRPLEPRGREQARALADTLGRRSPARLVTSPAVRCVQTLEPLAAALGLEQELREELAEPQQATAGASLVRELAAAGATVVVCGHGGLERAVLDDPPRWRKGAIFVLDEALALVEAIDAP